MGKDWKDYFEDRILERGYDYYLSDFIKNIRQVDDTVFATVSGTDDYQVIIELDDDGKPWNICNTILTVFFMSKL